MHQTSTNPEEEGNFLGLMFMTACPFKAASTDNVFSSLLHKD
jgi:hypothetical protein